MCAIRVDQLNSHYLTQPMDPEKKSVNFIFPIGSLSRYLHGFLHPRWCKISSINSSNLLHEMKKGFFHPQLSHKKVWLLILQQIFWWTFTQIAFERFPQCYIQNTFFCLTTFLVEIFDAIAREMNFRRGEVMKKTCFPQFPQVCSVHPHRRMRIFHRQQLRGFGFRVDCLNVMTLGKTW